MEADQYQESLKSMRDYYNTIKYSREQGAEEKELDIIHNMHELGLDVELIAKSVKISVEAVREILKSSK